MKTGKPIGIFDSGIGGLTVLRELKKLLPNESFVYVGDTAHVPYGNKSNDSIIKFSKKLTSFLVEQHNVKLVIIACNTASSIVINELNKSFSVPFIDVISPLKSYLLKPNNEFIQNIGVIGTHNTISSNAYNRFLKEVNVNFKIFSKACPLFVPIIEEGLADHEVSKIMIAEYLDSLIKNKIHALILGCTHYPILFNQISSYLSKDIKIINSAYVVASYTKEYLNENVEQNQVLPTTKLYLTDESQHFNIFAAKFLNNDFDYIKKINLF